MCIRDRAWTAAGRDPATLGPDPDALRRVAAYVEVHVEQGRALCVDPDDPFGDPALWDPARAVAIGTEIWPHGRWQIDVFGEANHAGTTALADRNDAMLGFASVVASARMLARERGCVATVGKVIARPNAVNAIADHVTTWLDARGADPEAVRGLVQTPVSYTHLDVYKRQPACSPTTRAWASSGTSTRATRLRTSSRPTSASASPCASSECAARADLGGAQLV